MIEADLSVCNPINDILIMEIYAAPKLSRCTTALGAYNSKSFTYEINQRTHTHACTQPRTRAQAHIHTHHTHARAHRHRHTDTDTQTHTHAHTHTHTHTYVRTYVRKRFAQRKIRQRNKGRRSETLLKEFSKPV